MAHTYTKQDGSRVSFEHLGDFLGELIKRHSRQEAMALPVLIYADIEGLHVAELVNIEPADILPPVPMGTGGGALRAKG